MLQRWLGSDGAHGGDRIGDGGGGGVHAWVGMGRREALTFSLVWQLPRVILGAWHGRGSDEVGPCPARLVDVDRAVEAARHLRREISSARRSCPSIFLVVVLRSRFSEAKTNRR